MNDTTATETTAPDTTPVQPAIDTSGADVVSMYQPTLKLGRQVRLCKILAFEPGLKKETNEFYGWRITLALEEDADDEFGGKIAQGTRLDPATLFTLPSQVRDQAACLQQVQGWLMALNNIPINRKNKQSCEAAIVAYKALPAEKRLPTQLDENAEHYAQWVGTYVKAVLVTKAKKDTGEVQTNVADLLAKDAPVS